MRQSPFALGLALVAVVVLPGCMDGGNGNLTVQATDAPGSIDDFESLTVTIDSIRVHASGGGDDEDAGGTGDGLDDNETADANDTKDDGAGWQTFAVDAGDREFDLTELLDGNTTTLLNVSLDAGHYTQIRLDVSSARGTLDDGGEVDVGVPNNALKIVKSFTIEAGRTTTFIADINVVETGNGEYKLQPVVGKSKVVGPE